MSLYRPCASNNSKSLKMNPFLRNLKQPCPAVLHPDYVCWYNSCEDLSDWTIDATITPSINNITFQEDKGCLQLLFPAAAKTAKLTSISACDKYWGFWVRFKDNAPTIFYLTLFGTPATYFVNWYISAATAGKWAFQVGHTTGGTWGLSDITIVADTWYWMELYYDAGTKYWFAINGDLKWTYTTPGIVGDFSAFWARNQGGADKALIDYLRLADRYEYPPT